MTCPYEKQAEQGRRWYSSNNQSQLNLAHMLGLKRKWLWQNNGQNILSPPG